MELSQKLKVELSYGPAIPLLGIHPEELQSRSQKDIWTPMSTPALFTVAKRWRPPQCARWATTHIQETGCVPTMGHCSVVRKEILQNATGQRTLIRCSWKCKTTVLENSLAVPSTVSYPMDRQCHSEAHTQEKSELGYNENWCLRALNQRSLQ